MLRSSGFTRDIVLVLCASIILAAHPLLGGDALFIGNSFTNGHTPPVKTVGGVPRMVEIIAESKGRNLCSSMSAPDGWDWGKHRKSQQTQDLVQKGSWRVVVLQNLSTQPTRIGDPRRHLDDGAALVEWIQGYSPDARIVLYETWPRHPKHPLCRESSLERAFFGSSEMMDELREGYARLAQDIQKRYPEKPVAVARVGEAFERCRVAHPEIPLYFGDLFHANANGSYLAALVLYSAMFNDTPNGATMNFLSFSIPEDIARKLQKVSEEVWSGDTRPPDS